MSSSLGIFLLRIKHSCSINIYTEAGLKFKKLNTQAQQRGAVVQGRSLSPYRLRYNYLMISDNSCYTLHG
ncbi:MAG: hypothetical protein LBK06_06650 [Planctomycetaceae bacterium]|nr:hypothetical protein [Planctomycetaceae bacterium]